MIEGKFRYKGEEKWNYRDFNSEKEMLDFMEADPKQIVEYDFRAKEKPNFVKNWFSNIKNTRKNWKKVKGSPYASLVLAYKARKIIVGLLIAFIAYRGYDMVINFRGQGTMAFVTKVIMTAVIAYICYRIYATIPQAKAQIEYYRKYPHTINYVPTNTKQTVDEIFENIKNNKKKEVPHDARK